ncbi:PTS sugar transporter subunit IIB [Branchiibius cervicis]|uniref:PTS sugar transporter subunit IIB n=1 Tax=Branchiibius cervicis TaxID=908252 RepID=A0ABW2AZ66_9MICO
MCVCGMGIGTSVLLKMNVEKAADNLGVDATVTTADISTARGAAQGADLIMTSDELAEELGQISTPVQVVDNFMDISEIQTKLADHLG